MMKNDDSSRLVVHNKGSLFYHPFSLGDCLSSFPFVVFFTASAKKYTAKRKREQTDKSSEQRNKVRE